jgi:hypothetical protein
MASNDDQSDNISNSSTDISSTSSVINEECDRNDTPFALDYSDCIDQVYGRIKIVNWSEEPTVLSNNIKTSYCCLGISPAQFHHLKYPLNVFYARMTMEYIFKHCDQFNINDQMSLIVLIVDTLQQYNFHVFKGKSLRTGVALKFARDEGNKLIYIFRQAASQLPPELAQRVTLVFWDDICNDEYINCVTQLKEHITNDDFSCLLNQAIDVFINRRSPNRTFSDNKRAILKEYVLNELPSIACGVVHKNNYCPIIVHPVILKSKEDSDDRRNILHQLVRYIKNSSELRSIMNNYGDTDKCQIYDIVLPMIDIEPPTPINPTSN